MRVNRKELKKQARRSLKGHYWLFVVLCLGATYLGADSSGSMSVISMPSEEAAMQEVSTGVVPETPQMSTVIAEAIMGENEESRETSRELKEQAEDAGSESAVLGRSRGVLAQAVNQIESGAMIATVIMAVRSVVQSTEVTLILFIIASFLLAFLFWFFFTNMFTVIVSRMFLEGRIYEKVSPQRLLFLMRVKRWIKVSCTMFVTSFLQILWSLTIVGGVIKHYSYFLVPYIAAENPDIRPRTAVTLSRRMMKGHKWECFLLELSYLGWSVLGGLTASLTEIFYSGPYRLAGFAEYYAHLRKIYKEEDGEGQELLNDKYLFEVADLGEVVERYSDVIFLLDEDGDDEENRRPGIGEWLAGFFGVTLFYSAGEKEYEERVRRKIKMASLRDAVSGKTYPLRMSASPEQKKRDRIELINYFRRYSVWSLLLMFFIFSFIGWLWEVSLHLITDGEFVNRGVLHGPWLPIYGCGGILILVFLNRLRRNPLAEFIAIVVLCGCVEYFSSLYLEIAHNGQRWWDYSGYFLNLNGRICAEGLLVFGLGGLAIVYVLAPLLDNQIRRIKGQVLVPASLALAVLFVSDLAYSMVHPNEGKGITDYQQTKLERPNEEGESIDAVLSCADGRDHNVYLSKRVS